MVRQLLTPLLVDNHRLATKLDATRRALLSTIIIFLQGLTTKSEPPHYGLQPLSKVTQQFNMDTYFSTLDSIGESIVAWTDPENQFRGHTDVS